MKKKYQKILKRFAIVMGAIIVVGFALNWFLTNRLEGYLKKELNGIVLEATDGFYQFTFDQLSIGFFNGELSITGIDLQPDSTTFAHWQKNDSLPDVYYKVHIDTIHFKGVNLTWKISYNNLTFDLLEIKRPDIKAYEAYYSRSNEKTKGEGIKLKDLHQMLSPYIDVLNIRKINLDHASVIYIIEDPSSHAVYALRDVSFWAYEFRLDSESYNSGKLLYCDNFEFITNQPQTLLSDNFFELNMETIRLSTQDSVIEIGKTRLIPQKKFEDNDSVISANPYIQAQLHSVLVKGIEFRRFNANNYLNARSFDILQPVVLYTNKVTEEQPKPKKEKATISKEDIWTLYSMISPILYKVSIEEIGVQDAHLQYSSISKNGTDNYTLDNFNFNANNFLVDSLADTQQKFMYSDNFNIKAKGIHGKIESNNHVFDIVEMKLDTKDKLFSIKNINLNPLSIDSKKYYLSGAIDSININGLEYDGGVSANELNIEAPVIRFTKGIGKAPSNQQKAEKGDIDISIIAPFIDHLTIKEINLNKANFKVHDRITKRTDNLTNLNFQAKNFFISEKTMQELPFLFSYDNFKINFEKIDYIIPDGTYLIVADKGIISTFDKHIQLRNVSLIPQEHSWRKAPDVYLGLKTPLIDIKGDIDPQKTNMKISSFLLQDADVRVVKTGNTNRTQKSKGQNQLVLKNIFLGISNITNAKIRYTDKTNGNELATSLKSFEVKNLSWNSQNTFSIGDVVLQTPNIKFVKGNDDSYDLQTELLNLSKLNLNNTFFSMENFKLDRPIVKINTTEKEKKTESKDSVSKSIYDILGEFRNKISIQKFDISNADITRISTNDSTSIEQHFTPVNLNFRGLAVNSKEKTFNLETANFNTNNLKFPVMNDFYTLSIGAISLKDKNLYIDSVHLLSKYPKNEFAYKHPKHKDWFDVTLGDLSISGLNIPDLVSKNKLDAQYAQINNVVLQNYKNQNIEIQHNIMPMIYEGLQKAPLKIAIDSVDVNNFSVIYEELSRGATIPGRILLTNLNGHFSGLTNIASAPDQFIRLDADGKFMGETDFTARWMIPVSKDYDRFLLDAHIPNMNLTDMNQLITPMASAEVRSGFARNVRFSMDASSKGATVDMEFPYNNLEINILKSPADTTHRKFITGLANLVIRSNNPNNEKSKLRTPHITIKRDPYHSTFNYLWQILQPPLVESVGIPKGTQDFAKGVSSFFGKVKNFFSPKKKKKEQQESK